MSRKVKVAEGFWVEVTDLDASPFEPVIQTIEDELYKVIWNWASDNSQSDGAGSIYVELYDLHQTASVVINSILKVIEDRLLSPGVVEQVARDVHARHLDEIGMTGPAYAFDTMTPKARQHLIEDRRDVIKHAFDASLKGSE